MCGVGDAFYQNTFKKYNAFQNLLKAHDDIADRQTHPIVQHSETDLLDYPLMQYGEESVKIVHLEKTNEHLVGLVCYLISFYLLSDYQSVCL